MVSFASRRRKSYASHLQSRQDRCQSLIQSQLMRFWVRRAWSAFHSPTRMRTLGPTVLWEESRVAREAQEDLRGHVDLSWTTEPA